MTSEIEKYLKAILDLIYRKDELEQISFDLSIFSDKIGYNSVVKSSGDETDKRRILVESNLENIETDSLRNYFEELIKKGDLWLFDPGHFKTFSDEFAEISAKIVFFNLTAAIELNDEDTRNLTDKLSKKMERKVVIQLKVDKNILGGAIIKKDNFILDYSLKTRMNILTSQWKKSIQKAG